MNTTTMSQTHPAAQGPELVFGLVGPIGCDLAGAYHELRDALETVGYLCELVHLSDLLRKTTVWQEPTRSRLDTEIENKQRLGSLLRAESKRADALAILGIKDIRDKRTAITGDPDRPAPRRAYVIRQLKNPTEVACLRQVYGQGFFLIGLYSPKARRTEHMKRDLRSSTNEDEREAEKRAKDLIEIDEKEEGQYGQNTRDTFPEADLFVTDQEKFTLKREIGRFIEMIFGHPFHTPSRAEYLMYQATAASLRSSDMGRQVGAVVASIHGDVIAIGANEVPKVDGGLTWAGDSPDLRDFKEHGRDPSIEHKRDLIKDLLKNLQDHLLELKDKTIDDLMQRAEPALMKCKLMGIQEFGRPVHAEMAALVDAAARGVSVKGSVLYVTTFPCHNCAKHILAAGVRVVVFLEPYPKSLVTRLFEKEFREELQATNLGDWQLLLDKTKGSVVLCAYLGVAPRRYLQLFKMVERKDNDGKSLEAEWAENKRKAIPRELGLDAHISYIAREEQELSSIRHFIRDNG